MVVNMNMKSDGSGSINEYLSDTIAGVFDSVYTVDVKGSTNRELFASANPEMLSVMESETEKLADAGLREMMRTVGNSLVAYEGGGCVLTDDKAPVEVLGMRVIDELIQDEIGYYKEIFKREGIDGLL